MKKIVSTLILIMVIFTTKGQNIADTLNMGNRPKVNVKVNKVYDENGNLIRYDSVYEWSYSSGSGNIQLNVHPDSLFKAFKPWFDEQIDMNSLPVPGDFFSDSTMFKDFFNNKDFFEQWQNELFDFDRQLKMMDSLKRQFFKRYLEEYRNDTTNLKTF